jgi:hypothetical protein
VPVTINVNEPVELVESALTVRVEVAEDPDGGVTGPGKLIEMSEGADSIHE